MSFVGRLQLAYAVERVMVVPVPAGIQKLLLPGMRIVVKCRGDIALLFLCPVEMIIASDVGDKKRKELHWEAEFLLGFIELEKDFSSISETSIGCLLRWAVLVLKDGGRRTALAELPVQKNKEPVIIAKF